jgi:hypothetical protein
MSPTRIVLPPRHKPFADELLQVTGIDSLSNLFVVFLTRYGSHLKASWNISQPIMGQHFQPPPLTYSTTEVSVVQSQNHNQSDKAIPDPEPEIDPVIERIARFVDRF